MPYSPLNVDVYTAAYSGALAGISSKSSIISGTATSGSFVYIAEAAGWYAEIIDMLWSGAPSELDLELLTAMSTNIWQTVPPMRGNNSNAEKFTNMAQSVIKLIESAHLYYAEESIQPPLSPTASIALVEGQIDTLSNEVTAVENSVVALEASIASTVANSRLTALDANHIHAWELTETSGSFFEDTGNTSAPVPLTISGLAPDVGTAPNGLRLGYPGLLGPCPIHSGSSGIGCSSANLSAVVGEPGSDFPTGANSYTLEYWYQNLASVAAAKYAVVATHSNGGSVTWSFNPTATAGELSAYTSLGPFGTIANGIPSQQLSPWIYNAVTFDSASSLYKVYVNGNLVYAPATLYAAPNWTGQGTANRYFGVFGNTSTNIPLRGCVTRVRMSNIARPQTYFAAVYKKAMIQ